MKTLVSTVALLLAAVCAAAAAAPVPYLPVPKGAAVILNTGSTNTVGYRIVVQESGKAWFVHGATRAGGIVPEKINGKLFADLRAAMPLSQLPVVPCMKSASFGTMTFVWWRGERSHDISCPGSAKASALQDDAVAVAASLHISAASPIMHMPRPGSATAAPSAPPNASPMSVRLTARVP